MARSSGVVLLSAAILLLAVGGLGSAPAPVSPEPPGSPDIDRYLYDDTDALLIFDVKASLRSPSLKGLFTNPLLSAAFTSQDGTLRVLGECGISLARDVDRLVAIGAPSCYSADSGEGGGVSLLQGRFNTAQMRQKLAGLIRAGKVEEEAVPRGKVYRVKEGTPTGYIALLDSSTIAVASTKKVAADAVARAGTNHRPKIKHKEIARFVKTAKPGLPLQALALETTVLNTTNPTPGKKANVKHHTLGDATIRTLLVRVESDKQLRTLVDLTCKTQADADTMVGQVQGVLAILPQALKGNDMAKQLQPVLALVESIKVKSEGNNCIVESKIEHKALIAALEALAKLAKP